MTVVNAVEVATTSTKKPNNGKTLINIVLDETGSMNSCWDATIASFNDYIGSQKTLDGECVVSLTTFSDIGTYLSHSIVMKDTRTASQKVRKVFENSPVQTVSPLSRESYRPNGGTNLYDAIGITIRNIETQLEPQTEVPNVLVVVITDGEENASSEYRLNDVKTLIQAKEKDGWTFVYLGANQDAWKVGASFGLSKGQTMSYATSNMSGTMSTLSEATTVYRGQRAGANASMTGTTSREFFTDTPKDKAEE